VTSAASSSKRRATAAATSTSEAANPEIRLTDGLGAALPKVIIANLDQWIAGLDCLVVVNQHGGNDPGALGTERGHISAQSKCGHETPTWYPNAGSRCTAIAVASRRILGVSSIPDALHLGERAMDQRNAGRTFADSGSDAFRAAGAHVSDGEDARQAGLVLGLWTRGDAWRFNACACF
jgi:hypothetical protein